MQKKYIALIPVCRPSAFLPELLEQLKSLSFEIIVVGYGSVAKYEHIFWEYRRYAKILHHTENTGKGTTLKTRFSHISANLPLDVVVVIVEADGQHKPDDALAVCKFAEHHPNSLVLGSRRINSNVPLCSKFGNTVTRFVYRLSTGLNVYDTQTGLRAFNARLIPICKKFKFFLTFAIFCGNRHWLKCDFAILLSLGRIIFCKQCYSY